jgi:hypothetical protein
MNKLMRSMAVAAAFTFTMAAAPSRLHAAPVAGFGQNHDDHPEYKKNTFYKLGNQEGYEDYQKKTQRTDHNHKYRNDEDRKAHDYGYQQGLQGHRAPK